MQQEDQHIDLPDLGHEGQCQRDTRPHQIKRHQQRAARHPVREGPGDGGDAHIGHHLDGEDRAQHQRGPVACKIEGQQTERDRCESGSQKRHDLRQKQMTVGAVGKDIEHGEPQR